MRILHITPTYLPATRYGGPIHSVHGLCRAQAARGDDPHVFTTNVDGAGVSNIPLGAPVERDGVRITYFMCGVGRRLYRSPAMRRALDEAIESFDIVHLHSVYLWPTLAGARAASAHKKPYVVSPRGMLAPQLIRARSVVAKTAWIALFERKTLAGAAAIHVTSEAERAGVASLRLPVSRCCVVPNGVDAPPMIERMAPAQPFILALGRVSWKKGLDRLIRAMAHVGDGVLVIAGNDEEELTPRLQSLAESLGLSSRVHFSGPVNGADKWRLLAQARIVALASHSENFGNVILEAMAVGAPVVVTPQVGLAADVFARGAGLVVDGDPDILGPSLASLFDDPERCARMGAAGRTAAVREYSWAAVAARMDRLYRDAIAHA